jgi:hypothetical protein
MSPNAYEAELVPDDRLRAGLLAFACGAILAGMLLVWMLPVTAVLKAALAACWMLAGILELAAFRRGMARIYRIRIRGDGSVLAVGRSGMLHALLLLPGSVVLDRFAWLRLRFDDGLRCGELLTGDAPENEQWRRLLVIWRQRGRFGGTPGS